MISKKLLLLAPGVVFGAMVMASDAAVSAPAETPAVEAPADPVPPEVRENVGRQELLFRSSEMVNEANRLMLDGKYREAIAKYREIIALLTPATGGSRFSDKVEFCRRRISDCYYQMAGEAMRRADEMATSYDFEEAIRYCEEAKEYCPERREELDSRIVFYTQRRDAAQRRESADVARLEANLPAQQYQIQLLLEQGIVLARRNELIQAKRKFEQVLLIDPYNDAAMQNLYAINTRIQDAAAARANASARRRIGEVEWAAALPILAAPPSGTGDNQLENGPVEKPAEDSLEQILRNLYLPNYALYDDLQTFSEAMRDLQAQTTDEAIRQQISRPINFVIRDVEYSDPAQAPKLAGYSPVRASVYDILVGLQERGDLSFKVDENAVVIVANGRQLEHMTTEVFSFTPPPGTTAESLKAALQSGAQVTFDTGASLTLVEVRNEVISRNTPANQRKIENWLANNGDRGIPMVQIMFKFIEVAQNDLDELGFNWGYSRMGHTSFSVGGNALLRHYNNSDGNDRFGGASTAGGIDNSSSRISGRGDSDATYNFSWGDSTNRLTASIYALDWADSSDVLYSPRVTTLDGTTARVNMTERHYYPGDYEDSDSEREVDEEGYITGYFIVQPQPTLDDERDLGITFNITPQVQGDLIRARVLFNILQFDSWLIVDSRNPSNDDDDGEYQKKAVLTSRYIDTDVTLKDGETVLIGSISQDLTTIVHDKIPILGDIPFVGRFFQSRYTISKKNNLLVFMTCRLINPDGSAVFKDEQTGEASNNNGQRGLPQFSRNQ